MSGPQTDPQEEKPLDPAAERVRRKLVRFMAINLGILFLALMAVVAALVYKAMKSNDTAQMPASMAAPPSGQEPLAGDIVLPVGSRLVSQSLSGTRLALDVELSDGSRSIFVYDTVEGRIVGRFAVRTQ
ncbi:fimbrial protein [Oryzicola mucosus]|uniref:Fimbrial protein n=1 Tax=Oryzicola mucosus TaxID=2767425 RepID=A0A8J6U1C1_9HYPH|nr:fimbrial protein [Oryzicola mucosus]MBD0414268.1 fimbrial protein [Oryzicola mucosus]